jgi:SAM-dependent methyltransferase
MEDTASQAAIELRLDWEQDGIQHSNSRYFGKFNFWRDILPGALSARLPDSGGERISEQFAPGELVAPWSERNIHRVRRSALRLQRRHGPDIRLYRGRHYPRYIAAGVADIFAGNVQPLRVVELGADTVILDLNHPLARLPLSVHAHIDHRLEETGEHGGRCNDAMQEIFNTGAGLEYLYAPGTTEFFQAGTFARMDPRADELFYRQPRLVQHIDRTAIAHISALYGRRLAPGMRVLDLMSSWVSHLPDSLHDVHVTGLGMNAEELAQNPRLAERIVQDLNTQAVLPFADRHFDAVICTVSVEYLVEPAAVFSELARVLKPGAPLVITFSDRWFPSKAIALWSELHPFERVALVQEYCRSAGFERLTTETMHGHPRPQDDPHAGQLASSDPVYSVTGYAPAGVR